MDAYREQIAFASAARTASENSPDLLNLGNKPGAQVIIDVTAVTATPSVTFKVQGKDPASGKYYDLIESAAITGVGTTVLSIRPGITTTANLAVSNSVPKRIRVVATHADADSITYSVGVNLVD